MTQASHKLSTELADDLISRSGLQFPCPKGSDGCLSVFGNLPSSHLNLTTPHDLQQHLLLLRRELHGHIQGSIQGSYAHWELPPASNLRAKVKNSRTAASGSVGRALATTFSLIKLLQQLPQSANAIGQIINPLEIFQYRFLVHLSHD